MVWGMFSAAGVGPLLQLRGRLSANVYQNLLQQHAVPPTYTHTRVYTVGEISIQHLNNFLLNTFPVQQFT